METGQQQVSEYSSRLFAYAFPCILVWATWLFVFFPGLMSGDSLDQWKQMTTFQFADYHPVFHTLVNWLVTRLWESPAAVVLMQIFFLSLVFGAGMVQLEKLGVPAAVRVLITVFFAVTPANGLMVMNLWKDVPYNASLLWLTVLCIRIFGSDGAWLKEWRHQVQLGFVLLLVVLFRHNGILPAMATMLAILLLYLEHWQRLLKVVAACTLIVLLFKGPFYAALDVKPTAPWQGMSMPIHQVGAMMHHGAALRPQDEAMLAAIMPLEEWRSAYKPYTVDTLVHNPKFKKTVFDRHSEQFLQLWARLVILNPGVAAKDWTAQVSLLWSVPQPEDGYTYTTQRGIDWNRLGLSLQHPLPPASENGWREIIAWADDPDHVWFVWRPALYLYLMLAFGALAVARLGSGAALMLVPVLANVAGLLLTLPAQDVRYAYGVLITAPFVVGLAFCNKLKLAKTK